VFFQVVHSTAAQRSHLSCCKGRLPQRGWRFLSGFDVWENLNDLGMNDLDGLDAGDMVLCQRPVWPSRDWAVVSRHASLPLKPLINPFFFIAPWCISDILASVLGISL
jgi:hypothetical protein